MKTLSERLQYAMYQREMTRSELSVATGLSEATISHYITGRNEPKTKNIQILAKALKISDSWLAGFGFPLDNPIAVKNPEIPVFSKITDRFIKSSDNLLAYEAINAKTVRDGSEFFAVAINDESMEPRMYDGDIVIVRKQSDVESGQTAIVWVNGESVCRKVTKRPDGILLQPLNRKFDSVHYSIEDMHNMEIVILGRVVEVRSKL